MKRNDELLSLAFGELSEESARALEANADAAERVEIEAFRALRAGLQHLPPPPPDRLSADRLRAAILDRELAEKRASKPFAWAWAPLALAALAAVVFVARPSRHADPQLVMSDDARFSQPIEKPRFDFGSPPKTPVAKAEPQDVEPSARFSAASEGVRADAPREVVAVRHIRRRRRSIVTPAVEPGRVAMKAPGEDATPMAFASVVPRPEPETIAAPPSTVVEAPMGAVSGRETVVIVSANRDLETGAPAATEKEASGVLVGG